MSAVVVFCPRPAPGTWAAAVLRELARAVELRPCGPGWPAKDLATVDPAGVRLLLELDASRGPSARPAQVTGFGSVPRVAWLVETSRKPDLHREVARGAEVVFHAHPAFAAALGRPSLWLPLCADEETFRPREADREWDVAFVGQDPWRADSLVTLGRERGIGVSVVSPAGEGVQARAAEVYARAKAVFHRHLTHALDVRVLEALSAGRVVLVDRRENGLEALLGREALTRGPVLTYQGQEELVSRLDLLRDDARRAELEQEAAQLARAKLGARTRVGELLDVLEARFGRLRRDPTPPTEPARPADLEFAAEAAAPMAPPPGLPTPESLFKGAPECARGGRWLVLADREPPAIGLRGYAERLARLARAAGAEVTVLRLARGRLPGRPARAGEPETREVSLGPLPQASTPENAMLLASGHVQRILDEVAREGGPFQALLAEGPLGALVGPPAAERLGMPFVLLLEDCEVARRTNHLTRDQLYRAELEHWAADRARLMVVPTQAAEAAARGHYCAKDVAVSGWPALTGALPDPASVERLWRRLSLPPGLALVRAPLLGANDAAALAGELGRRGQPAVVLGEAAVVSGAGEIRPLSTRPAAGPALAALALGCRRALHVGREDLGAADLAAVAPSFGVAPGPRPDEVAAALAEPGRARLASWKWAVLERLPQEPATRKAPVPAQVGGGA